MPDEKRLPGWGWPPPVTDATRARVRFNRKHWRGGALVAFLLVEAAGALNFAFSGSPAVALWLLLPGIGCAALLGSMMRNSKPSDSLMYFAQPPTGWGYPSEARSGRPWGPSLPDDYDDSEAAQPPS